MPKLHVLREEDALLHHVLRQRFENHVGQRLALEHVAADEFAEHVELLRVDVLEGVLVGAFLTLGDQGVWSLELKRSKSTYRDSLNDTTRYHVDCRNQKR